MARRVIYVEKDSNDLIWSQNGNISIKNKQNKSMFGCYSL